MQKWEYQFFSVRYGEESGWQISIDGELYKLREGLNYLGKKGWELVGLQHTDLKTGGYSQGWYQPTYFYVFKRPLTDPGPTSDAGG